MGLLRETRRMFKLWHRVRDGTLPQPEFVRKVRPIQLNVLRWLEQASRCRNRRVRGMAKEILRLDWALFAFVDTPDVEPTNNFGERQIRHAVMLRKGCFGTDSAAGSRFVERMLTVIATLRQQQRSALEFVTAACDAALSGAVPPSLLPEHDQVTLRAA
jgi:transposase